jgi:predicted transcriptional regulator YdeE
MYSAKDYIYAFLIRVYIRRFKVKLYLPLYGHANQTSLPLRFGIYLSEKHQCFCELEDAIFDEESTNSQRVNEIEKGRKHYTGKLSFDASDKSHKLGPYECRVVVEMPTSAEQSPKIITVMGNGSVKGDLTVTRHIEGMLKRNQITRDDLVSIFHPAYIAGKINDSNDCENLWRDKVQSQVSELDIRDNQNKSLQKSLASDDSNFDEIMAVNDIEETDVKAPLSYTKMIIPNVNYEYVMADAYVESVTRVNNKIVISFINSKGQFQKIESFPLLDRLKHLEPLHDYAFEYLKNRQEQRAKIAICVSDGYRGTFAESVTAIALQLSRKGKQVAF